MQKSFKTTAMLAGILVVLLGWYFIFEENVRKDWQKAEEKSKRLVTLESKDVTDIQLVRPKDEKKADQAPLIHLHKTGDKWNIVKPVESRADVSTINSLLSAVTTAVTDRTVEDNPKNLKEYGLDPAELTVRVRKNSASEFQEIQIGKDTPIGFSVFAYLPATKKLVTVSRSLKNSANKDLFNLREKQILKIARFRVDEVEIKRKGKQPYFLKKDDKDNWLLARSGIPANSTEWSKTLTALVDMKATKFLDSPTDIKGFGLDNPQVRVFLRGEQLGSDKVQISINKKGSETYVKLADQKTVYLVDKEVMDRADQDFTVYRSENLARFNRFKVNRIRIKSPNGAFELQKQDSEWKLADNAKQAIDKDKVDQFLTALQDAKLEKYLGAKNKSFQSDWAIELVEKKDKAEEPHLGLYFKKMGAGYTVQNNDVPLAYTISGKTSVAVLRNKTQFFKDAKAEKSAEKAESDPTKGE